mmetsp:Transcript_6146/g.9779  ORF Transcript_6146/g.9779 Transcript_6146/m.9779 type:complete len:234 (-) Transcript_6146:709-1410(-)
MRCVNIVLILLSQACTAHTTFIRDKKWKQRSNRNFLEKVVSNSADDDATAPDVITPTKNDPLHRIQGGAKTVLRKLSGAELAFAGAVATMIGDASMHPIDCIKTLQQSDGGAGLNMVAAAKNIFASGGIGGFYSGLGTYVISDGLAGSIKFATYEALKHWVDENVDEKRKGAALFAVAGLAFLASSVVLVPGELIKQRLQMGQISSIAEGFSSIWKNEGFFGFFYWVLGCMPS